MKKLRLPPVRQAHGWLHQTDPRSKACTVQIPKEQQTYLDDDHDVQVQKHGRCLTDISPPATFVLELFTRGPVSASLQCFPLRRGADGSAQVGHGQPVLVQQLLSKYLLTQPDEADGESWSHCWSSALPSSLTIICSPDWMDLLGSSVQCAELDHIEHRAWHGV